MTENCPSTVFLVSPLPSLPTFSVMATFHNPQMSDKVKYCIFVLRPTCRSAGVKRELACRVEDTLQCPLESAKIR